MVQRAIVSCLPVAVLLACFLANWSSIKMIHSIAAKDLEQIPLNPGRDLSRDGHCLRTSCSRVACKNKNAQGKDANS